MDFRKISNDENQCTCDAGIFHIFFSKNTTFFLESVFGKKRICSKKSLKKRIFSLFISSIKQFCSNLGHDPIHGRFARAEIHKIWWLVMIIFQIDCFCTRENVFTNFWDTPYPKVSPQLVEYITHVFGIIFYVLEAIWTKESHI